MPRQAKSGAFSMLSLERCKKVLGEKAVGMTDEFIEQMRDELYIAANLAFSHWHKSNASTKAGKPSPFFVGAQPTSNPLPVGDPRT